MKQITYILLALAIPFSGFATSTPNLTVPFYFGLSGGMNNSMVNFKEASSDYSTSYQIAFECKAFVFPNPQNSKNALLFGLSYESKNYSILNLRNETLTLESDYITIPIKYQHLIVDIGRSSTANVLFGGFYSFKLDENSIDKDTKYLNDTNYGIIAGFNVVYDLNTEGTYIFIEYNLQYGFAKLQNTVTNSGNLSHLINIGFKFPSTVF